MESSGDMDNFNFDVPQFTPTQPGSTWADLTPHMMAPDNNPFAMDGSDLTDETDPKRRRIARACDMCRKKKIKCDGKLPKCGHCLNYKTECVFTQVEKKRNPPKGAKYIEGLENRLGRMESLLKMSGLLSEEEAGKTDLGTLERRLAEKARLNSASHESSPQAQGTTTANAKSGDARNDSPQKDSQTSPIDSVTSPGSASDREKAQEVENLSDLMCSLVTNSSGETRYIGSSSAFSIFSQRGIDWVNDKTGDTSFEESISAAVAEEVINPGQSWRPDIFGDLFMRRIFRPLPPKQEALLLFRDYFDQFNCMFPLFHEPTFMHLVDRQYSSNPYEGSGWWACINVALAIAHRLRVMSELVPQEDDQKGWMYLKNALGVLTELTMRNQDLLSVQALFGMALFLQGTPNPQPSFLLISCGMRLAHSIGLHKKGSAFNLHPVEAEQRKRVFWIGYMLDKDSCLRSGRPPVQDDDDMNVDLPSEQPDDDIGNIPLADGKSKINLFRKLVEFCLICSKVYKDLYSVKASKQSDGELLNTIGDLDKELENWKDSIPIEFRPEHEIKAIYQPLVFQIVVLHFSYYNCLVTIHRMAVHHGYWTSRLSEYAIQGLNSRPLNPRVFSSAALCVAAARASIHLIKYLPQGDFACVWMIVYFPVSSLVTIFANVLQNPQDAKARPDIKLMELVVNFLSNIVNEEGTGGFRRMLNICNEFTRIARFVVDRAEKEGTKRKRKILPEENQQQTAQAAMHQARQSMNRANRPTASPKSAMPATFNSVPTAVNESTAHGMGLPEAPVYPTMNPTFTNGSPVGQNGFGTEMGDMLGQQFGAGLTNGASTANGVPSFDTGSFQQPFVPPDLWASAMTFEWDLANNFEPGTYPMFEGHDELNLGNAMP